MQIHGQHRERDEEVRKEGGRYVRWFWMRSRPETRRSTGYQNCISRRMAFRSDSDSFACSGIGAPRKM
eukprot:3563914-Rhodomonas_salina.1